MPRSSRRQYNRVAAEEEGPEDFQDEVDPLDEQVTRDGRSLGRTASSSSSLEKGSGGLKDAASLPILDESTAITVIVLDSAQKRFPIKVNSHWTIAQFKKVGATVHKVAPAQQRLIFRGKLLTDEATLEGSKIDSDNVIVHLFPKPRVVVASSSNNNDDASVSITGESDGAHIPQIILDEDEAERRGQILVLGSHEIAEAQNNVRLLSLLLLVISSMRLLALFSIAMGLAEEPERENEGGGGNHTHQSDDDYYSHHGQVKYETRTWQPLDYYDLAVSSICFYVAFLGMKATNENTLRMANAYMFGVVLAGITWNSWNAFMYALFVKEESTTDPSADPDAPTLSRDDFLTVAFFTVLIPALVWMSCMYRAFVFRRLIAEAEFEAAERIRAQLNLNEDMENDETSQEMTELRREDEPGIV